MCVSVQRHAQLRGIFALQGQPWESARMPHRSMMDLIADLHLEPLFMTHLASINTRGRHVPRGDPAIRHSKKTAINSAKELAALLQHLGVRADSPAMQCYAHVDGATARAVETIAEWMIYLPENCVRAMVSDGWHWST
jgi:hypothetical protein